MVRKVTVKPDAAKTRTLRIGILGPNTARCESCTADCSKTVGEWVVDGLCSKCHQQRVAGR